jgi:Ca2+-binding EF-hand superfamily protein
MFDKNASGSIDVSEFGQLFSYINQWKAVFEGLDKDRNCYLENAEVQQGE